MDCKTPLNDLMFNVPPQFAHCKARRNSRPFQMLLPQVASIKGNKQSLLPVNGVVSFHPESAASVSLCAREAVDNRPFVLALGILLVFKELGQAKIKKNSIQSIRSHHLLIPLPHNLFMMAIFFYSDH